MQPQTQRTEQQTRPNDELDLLDEVANESVNDDFLSEQNLGVGNYSSREMYQQIQSFQHGLFSESAFGELLYARAIEDTQVTLAKEGWRYIDPREQEVRKIDGWEEMSKQRRREIWEDDLQQNGEQMTKRRWLERRGEKVFQSLIEARSHESRRYPAREAMDELAGWDGDWQSPHFRMIMARHETSRSRDARLLDNVFGRIKKTIQETDRDDGGGLRR